MSEFGNSIPAGYNDYCAQCKNFSEVRRYPRSEENPDPNPQAICESCYRENVRLERKIHDKAETYQLRQDTDDRDHVPATMPHNSVSYPTSTPSHGYDSAERARYVDIVVSRASDDWVESFIAEIVVKKVLRYDWKEIIKSERWFSVLDLRKFALEVDPNFERQKKSKRKRTATVGA